MPQGVNAVALLLVLVTPLVVVAPLKERHEAQVVRVVTLAIHAL
jgi:hypothetical protein